MTMRAVGYRENLDVGDPASLVDVTMPVPVPGPHDLLVRVRAVSVNPIDTKIRRGSPVAGGAVRILGFDAAGTVEAIGPEVTRFGVGDDFSTPASPTARGRTPRSKSSTSTSSAASPQRWTSCSPPRCR